MSNTPILPGFHPDPSICRVQDDYYLVTSSFEYLPGVPIFHSRDLLHWSQIGNVLDRQELLDLPSSRGSSGIFAPTIRHHDGRFWMTTTDVERFSDGHLITSAEDPAGEWTAPVHVSGAVGIDPDLSWGEDGVCRITWSAGSGDTRIVQARIDPATGRLLSEPVRIFGGNGLAHAEAPHLFHRGGRWYLLLAEGGTERGHMVTVARSRTIDGPFEANPANPILTHRSSALPVQNTGHADIVETPDGEWVAVYLGVRPTGRTPYFHVNGRETFIAGIDWVDDWPVVDEERFEPPVPSAAFVEDFASTVLHPRWISPGVHPTELLRRSTAGAEVAVSQRRPASRPLVAVRTEHPEWQARATIVGGTGRLTVRMDDLHWASAELQEDRVVARVHVGPLDQVLASGPRTAGRSTTLVVGAAAAPTGEWRPSAADLLQIGYLDTTDGFVQLGSIDGRYLSTEVAGGFTGRVVGIEPLEGAASTGTIARFEYRSVPPGVITERPEDDPLG